MIINKEEICPKCSGQLEFDNGSNCEYETWQCLDCRTFYDVQIEIVRDWQTIEEI